MLCCANWNTIGVETNGAAAPYKASFSAAARRRRLNRQASAISWRWVCRDCFPRQADCEITLEANPGTVDAANFSGYRDGGVNRISVGVQSFQPQLLKFLGRIHSADEAKKALHVVRTSRLRQFQFRSDLRQSWANLAELEADLDAALEFQPPHLSAYNLTFEEGTPFHHEYRSGRMANLSEDEEIAMAELIECKARRRGLKRYEISNYARPGLHSRHNVNYWHARRLSRSRRRRA